MGKLFYLNDYRSHSILSSIQRMAGEIVAQKRAPLASQLLERILGFGANLVEHVHQHPVLAEPCVDIAYFCWRVDARRLKAATCLVEKALPLLAHISVAGQNKVSALFKANEERARNNGHHGLACSFAYQASLPKVCRVDDDTGFSPLHLARGSAHSPRIPLAAFPTPRRCQKFSEAIGALLQEAGHSFG